MARELGVSTATVAKALNGQGRISAAMVERVRSLARKLKYVPNISARSLRTNIKDAVGLLITSDITNPWYSLLTSELAEQFAKRGLTMLLALGKGSEERVRLAQENFFGGRVCGMICGPIINLAHLEQLRPLLDRQIPLVVFSNLERLPVNFVALEQEKGAQLAIEHLYALGHRRICYLGSPACGQRHLSGTRANGYSSFMESHSLPTDYMTLPEQNRKSAFEAVANLVANHNLAELPTALFCHNDDIALGALLAIQQAGLKVPQDISVTGFDDIAEASYSLPALTTIGGVMDAMASELVNALDFAVKEQPGEFFQSFITPKLILRATTAMPRSNS